MLGEKEPSGQKSAPAAEVSNTELAKLYKGGSTLAEIAAKTGLGRFAVAYRLEAAGTERRNRGSPQKTEEQKGAFARQRLEATFGESLAQAIADLRAGSVTAKKLAGERDINYSTFRTWLKRAGITVTDPSPATKAANEKGNGITIFDLVDAERGSGIACQILAKLNRPDFSTSWVANATDEQLKVKFGLTEEEILHIREQLRKNGFSS